MGFRRSHDLFRETGVRYLGYANEIAEALRPKITERAVRMSYAVATAYVLADTADKAVSKLKNDGRINKVIFATGDALIWQSLASVILPGVAINRIVFYSQLALAKHMPNMAKNNRLWASTMIGLVSIPIIVRPIDGIVHMCMNLTYRLLFS